MRSDASRASPRSTPAASSAAPAATSSAGEVRAAAPAETGARRVVVDASGRRSTALHHLLGTIRRSVADDDGVREELVCADREGAMDTAGTAALGAAMPASGRVAPVSRRRRAARGSDHVGAGRSEGSGKAGDGIWSSDVTEVQGPWSVDEADMKIGVVDRISRVTAVRARSAAPGHAAMWFRRGLFGALAAAVALLALLSGLEDDAGMSEQGASSKPPGGDAPARAADH